MTQMEPSTAPEVLPNEKNETVESAERSDNGESKPGATTDEITNQDVIIDVEAAERSDNGQSKPGATSGDCGHYDKVGRAVSWKNASFLATLMACVGLLAIIVVHSCLFCGTLNHFNGPLADGSRGAINYWWYWVWDQTLWVAPAFVALLALGFLTVGEASAKAWRKTWTPVLGRVWVQRQTKACVQTLCVGCLGSAGLNAISAAALEPYLMQPSRSLDQSSAQLSPEHRILTKVLWLLMFAVSATFLLTCTLMQVASKSRRAEAKGGRFAWDIEVLRRGLIPTFCVIIIWACAWAGAEVFAQAWSVYRDWARHSFSALPGGTLIAEGIYTIAFSSVWLVFIRFVFGSVERWVIVPWRDQGWLNEEDCEHFVLVMELISDSLRWLYGRNIFSQFSPLALAAVIAKDEFNVAMQFGLRFTEGNLLTYLLPYRMLARVPNIPFGVRVSLVLRSMSESRVLGLAYFPLSSTTRMLKGEGAFVLQPPKDRLKDCSYMRVADELFLVPLRGALATCPYTLDEVAERIQKEFKYDLRNNLSALAPPVKESHDVYNDAFLYAEAEDGAGLAALLALQSEHTYRGVLMSDEQAFSTLGPEEVADEVLQDDVTLDTMLADASMVQSMLKEAIAPSTDWAATSMDQTWSQHAKELGHQDKELRATRPIITYDEYVEGSRPSSRVKCNDMICDEAFDPGTKSQSRIVEKAQYKYLDGAGKPIYRRVRDIARLALLFDTPTKLLEAIPVIKKVFTVLEVENRFKSPTALGWRDITVLASVPCNGRQHIAELQLQLKVFALAREKAHKHYTTLRSVLPAVCKVQSRDMDRVQSMILEMLTSVHFVTELEDFEASRRRTDDERMQRATRRSLNNLVEMETVRRDLLSVLQASIFQRYIVFALAKVSSSMCLLLHRNISHSIAASIAVLPQLDRQKEFDGAAYWIVPAVLLLIDILEFIAMIYFMMRAYSGAEVLHKCLRKHLLKPMYYLIVSGVLCHCCADPINSRIGMRFC